MKNIIAVVAYLSLLSACTTNPYTGENQASNTAKGAAIGTAGGAAAGTAIGAIAGGSKGTWIGAIAGAGAGAIAGTAIGAYMDNQDAKLREELRGTGVSVIKEANYIRLIMPGNVTFASNDATINEDFKPVLNSVAKVIKEYNKTMVEITGHTDNTGSEALNMSLSLHRANAVSNHLRLQGVDGNRLISDGFGSKRPIASNDTASGREQNRRVEIRLVSKQ